MHHLRPKLFAWRIVARMARGSDEGSGNRTRSVEVRTGVGEVHPDPACLPRPVAITLQHVFELLLHPGNLFGTTVAENMVIVVSHICGVYPGIGLRPDGLFCFFKSCG
jgi:hypothetical protein